MPPAVREKLLQAGVDAPEAGAHARGEDRQGHGLVGRDALAGGVLLEGGLQVDVGQPQPQPELEQVGREEVEGVRAGVQGQVQVAGDVGD